MREIRLSGLEGGVAVTAIPTPIAERGLALEGLVRVLRDALNLSRLLQWAKATLLLSGHRYAIRTRKPVSR